LTNDEKKLFFIYQKARKQYLETLKNTKDSTDLKYAYNANYNSAKLIQNIMATLITISMAAR